MCFFGICKSNPRGTESRQWHCFSLGFRTLIALRCCLTLHWRVPRAIAPFCELCAWKVFCRSALDIDAAASAQLVRHTKHVSPTGSFVQAHSASSCAAESSPRLASREFQRTERTSRKNTETEKTTT